MASIVKATLSDAKLLSQVGQKTFIESHGISAPKEVVDVYVAETFNTEAFIYELGKEENVYHIINYEGQAAGYSKIILNFGETNVAARNVTKLERLYLLKEFYELKLGYKLFQFNIELSKQNSQSGMWLYVWKENYRAIKFYVQNGFEIIGDYNFKLSATHFNPNHQMFLQY